MFGKVTRSARAVVVAAMERAQAEGTSQISEDHLLAALLHDQTIQPLFPQLTLPNEAASIMAAITRARRRGGLSSADSRALAGVGIDLDSVIGEVEATLGEGAMDSRRRTRRRRLGPFMSEAAAQAVQGARQQASALGDRDVTAEHLLLGVLAQPGLSADILAERDVTLATVLKALDARRRPEARP